MQLLSNVDVLHAASHEQRKQLLDELLETLGAGWAASTQDHDIDALCLLHKDSRLDFVAVPGGQMTMGMTEHDLAAARARLGDGAWQQRVLEQLAAVARPPRKISVQPFLCSRGVLEEVPGELVDVGEDFDLAWPAQAKAFASKLGMRLISEAELEWLARNGEQAPFSLGAEDHHGGQSRFGIRDAFLGVWAADDWHPNYDGAPSDSNPWLAGDPEGVYRGGVLPAAIQSDEEWPHVMSAARYHGAEPSDYYGVRLSLDL